MEHRRGKGNRFRDCFFEPCGVISDVEQGTGVDLRCGGGRVAGKTCHRHVF